MRNIKKIFFTCVAICLILNVNAQQLDSTFYKNIENAFETEDFDHILSKSTQILKLAENHTDTLSAELLYYLSEAHLAYDELDQALEVMEKELTVRKSIATTDPLLIADIHYNLGFFYKSADNFIPSITHFEEASKIYKKTESEIAYTESQVELATVFSLNNQLDLAIKTLNKLSDNKTAYENYRLAIDKEKGNIYQKRGQYYAAEKILNANKKFACDSYGKISLECLVSTLQIADIKYFKAEYSEAEAIYLDALDISQKLATTPHITEVTKNNLSNTYSKIGLYGEANDLLSGIISDEKSLENAIRLQNLAINQSAVGQYDMADQNFRKALKILENLFTTDNFIYQRTSKEYANNVLIHTNLEEAISRLKAADNSAKNIMDESNPEYSKFVFNLGRVYYKKNEIKLAEKYISNAHQLRSKYLNKNHPLYAETSKELAELNWYKNKATAAEKYFKETFNNYFAQIEAYFPALSEQQKANFYTNILRSTFEEFNTFAIAHKDSKPNLLGDMYDYQLATKGLIMYATAKARKNILYSGDEQLIKKFENWINTKELIAQLYSMTEVEIKKQPYALDSLVQQSDKIEKELSRASTDFAEAYEAKNYSWKDIQAQLKEGEAAIEIIRFRKFKPDSSGIFTDQINYAALVINKNVDQPELILLENGVELENKYMKNYKNAIKYKVKDNYSYDFYWKPIADKTKEYQKLYISPDGIYNQISINTLYNTQTEKYVLEEQNIQLLTNTKDLIAYRNTSNSGMPNLASAPDLFGFPNYNKGLAEEKNDNLEDASSIVENVSLDRGLRGSLQRYIRGNSLVVSLPGTKEEVEKINKLYGSEGNKTPQTFLGDDADEFSLKSVNSPSVLHIATHGFFLEDSESVDNSDDKYAENPLLKSGLIMAGANSFISTGLNENNRQDGILTAYEAMNLNLTNTDLVVLSACETGLGDLKNGEGVYGLRRAFQVAGAEAIIMSLWSVDDAATQELMTSFYEKWIAGTDKLTAFNEAQMVIKEKYKDPFYWGAFVMVGE